MKSDRKSFICIGCKKDTWDEYYMVYTRIWKKVNPKVKGMLCINCVETRLGRKLNKKDFTTAIVNSMRMKRTPKLRNRLSSPPPIR